ncbi:MAG: MipA/OmpV family protein [Gallionellaceae bacterium]
MGAGVKYGPRYEGAATNQLRYVPILDINYRNGGFFIGVLRGIGFDFSESKYIKYGVRLHVGSARSPDNDAHLFGMTNIAYYPEASFFLSTRLGPLSFSSTAAGSSYGAHANLGCGLVIPLGKEDRLRLGVRANWDDGNYAQTYFGVSTTEAVASGNILTPYTATEGKRDTVLTAAWTHSFNKQWFANTGLTYKKLEGSAQFSPLAQRTSMNSMRFSLAYRF